jgi:hypothetical protein
MNDFCLYCTGNDKTEVITCKDRKCVFYKHRRANLEWQENGKVFDKSSIRQNSKNV